MPMSRCVTVVLAFPFSGGPIGQVVWVAAVLYSSGRIPEDERRRLQRAVHRP